MWMCKEPTHVPQNCTRVTGELKSVFRQSGCPNSVCSTTDKLGIAQVGGYSKIQA